MLHKISITVTSAIIFLFCVAEKAAAQEQRFRAGVVLGLNLAQIHGDDVGGYNKFGLHGGLRAIAVLREKMDISFELLYAQRGAFDKYGSPTCFNGRKVNINLQYVEVPVLFSFKDWYIEDKGFYRVQASAGFSYGRLINATSQGSCHNDETENFAVNDYSFTCGVEIFATKRIGIGLRWTRSLNLLYDRDKHDPAKQSLRGYFVSMRGAYIF